MGFPNQFFKLLSGKIKSTLNGFDNDIVSGVHDFGWGKLTLEESRSRSKIVGLEHQKHIS